MTTHPAATKAGQQYATAYAIHHTTKDLPGALGLYQGVMTAYPETPEAEYSRSQIKNIVDAVVPKHVLLDANVALALDQLRLEATPEAAPAPVGRLAEKGPG